MTLDRKAMRQRMLESALICPNCNSVLTLGASAGTCNDERRVIRTTLREQRLLLIPFEESEEDLFERVEQKITKLLED